MRFDVVSPGIGSRAELERMTRIDGDRPSLQVRERRAEQADRAPHRPVDRPRPGRLVEVLEPAGRRSAGVDDEQVEPAEGRDAGRDRRGRTVGRREVGRDGQGVERRGARVEPVARPGDEADLRALGAEYARRRRRRARHCHRR